MSGYPKANRTVQWFLGDVATDPMGPVEKVVWHTTETTSWPGYGGGATAPHYTVKANFATKRMEWRAHFPDEHNARALRNEAGGVQTNRDGALQVEIVGTCNQDPDTRPSWWDDPGVLRSWDLEPWQVEGLAEFVVYAHEAHDVPLIAPALWLAYGPDPRAPGRVPASYGDSPARFTGSQWDAFRGHCGHEHVDENAHGDPGRFPMRDILERAGELLAPPPPEAHAMSLPAIMIAAGQTQQYFVDGNVKRKIVSGAVSTYLDEVATDAAGVGQDAATQALSSLAGIAAQLSALAANTADDATSEQVQALAAQVAGVALAVADDATSAEVAELRDLVEATHPPAGT
jgi:hypothetical protein